MEKLFLNKDLSLLAKEKGFDEPCFGYYVAGLHLGFRFNYPEHNTNRIAKVSYGDKDFVFAPLYQQIIDWFRDKHNMHITTDYYYDGSKWNCKIDHINSHTKKDSNFEGFKNHYYALDKAIEEAFKLI